MPFRTNVHPFPIRSHLRTASSPTNPHSIKVRIYPKVIINKSQKPRTRKGKFFKPPRARVNKIWELPSLVTTCLPSSPYNCKNSVRGISFNFLQAFFAYASYIGTSPFRYGEPVVGIACKISYYITSIMGLMHTIIRIWYNAKQIVSVRHTTQISSYIHIASSLTTSVLRPAHLVSLWRDADKYNDLFTAVDSTSFAGYLSSKKNTALAGLICGMGFFRGIIPSIEGITTHGIQYVIQYHAANIKHFFVTQEHDSTGIDTSTYVLGLFGLVMSVAGGLLQQSATTGAFIAVLTLFSACKQFVFTTSPPGLETGTSCLHDESHGNQIAKRYRELKKISKGINQAFSPILKVVLLANLFLFATLMDTGFDEETDTWIKFMMLFDALLSCIFLYMANEIGNTGERFREWLKVDGNRIRVGMSELNVIQEDLSYQAIGIGKGAFYVNDTFLLGYAGAVAAYFLGIVETREIMDGMDEVSQTVLACMPNQTTAIAT